MRLITIIFVLIIGVLITAKESAIADIIGDVWRDTGAFIEPTTDGDGVQVNSPDGTKNATWKHDGTNSIFEVPSGGFLFNIGGVSQWVIDASGDLKPANDNVDALGLNLQRPSAVFTYKLDIGSSGSSAILVADGAGILAQRNSTNAQELRVYKTDDGAGNTEYFTIKWSGDNLFLETVATGTGTLRPFFINGSSIGFRIAGATQWVVSSNELRPLTDNVETFGTDALRPSTIYTYKLSIKDAGAQPTCAVGERGSFWIEEGGAGVKDKVEVCAKDAGDAYAWRVLY